MSSVERLTKTSGDRRAVDDLTFTVQPGWVTGFVGPNGADKSTTIGMMIGRIPPGPADSLSACAASRPRRPRRRSHARFRVCPGGGCGR
jgi:ABC-2 type transport system ATP-binding protein